MYEKSKPPMKPPMKGKKCPDCGGRMMGNKCMKCGKKS